MILLTLGLAIVSLLVIVLSRRAPFPQRVALGGYVGFWLVIPLAYHALAVEPLDSDVASWYGAVALAHTASVAAIVIAALMIPSPFTWIVQQGHLAHWRLTERWLRLGLILCAGIAIFARLWQFRAVGGDFLSLVAFNVAQSRDKIGEVTLLSALAGVYACVALAVVAAGRNVALRTRLVALGCVTAIALQNVATGLRAFLLLPCLGLLLLAGTAEPERRRALWGLAVIAGVIAAGLLPVMASVLGVTRFAGEGDGSVSAAQSALESLRELDRADQLRLFASAASVKFDGIVPGAVLLSRDGVGGGGLRPLSSSLLSPIPRLLLPSKPVPISADGEQTGLPYVRAAERFGSVEAGMVVPVSPAVVAIWELGWMGLVVFVTSNVILLWLVEAWLSVGGIVPATFAFSVLSYPSFEFLLQGPSSLVRDGLRMALAWFALAVVALAFHAGRESTVKPGG